MPDPAEAVGELRHVTLRASCDTESGGGEAVDSSSNKAVRRGSLKKVYSIISVQVFLVFLLFS